MESKQLIHKALLETLYSALTHVMLVEPNDYTFKDLYDILQVVVNACKISDPEVINKLNPHVNNSNLHLSIMHLYNLVDTHVNKILYGTDINEAELKAFYVHLNNVIYNLEQIPAIQTLSLNNSAAPHVEEIKQYLGNYNITQETKNFLNTLESSLKNLK